MFPSSPPDQVDESQSVLTSFLLLCVRRGHLMLSSDFHLPHTRPHADGDIDPITNKLPYARNAAVAASKIIDGGFVLRLFSALRHTVSHSFPGLLPQPTQGCRDARTLVMTQRSELDKLEQAMGPGRGWHRPNHGFQASQPLLVSSSVLLLHVQVQEAGRIGRNENKAAASTALTAAEPGWRCDGGCHWPGVSWQPLRLTAEQAALDLAITEQQASPVQGGKVLSPQSSSARVRP